MFGFFKKIFRRNSENLSEALKNGAVLVDVRTQAEYASGCIKNSINIPVNQLSTQLSKLKKDETIVVFCASGMRSASAKNILNRNGFENVINGGGWKSVEKLLKEQ